MKAAAFSLLFLGFVPGLASAQRITVKGNRFEVGGNPIWISGANTPWNTWNEFGNKLDAGWWGTHLAELRAAGVNCTRVWISCDGNNASPGIDADGKVTAPTQTFWRDLDTLFAQAQKQRVYLMLALFSFDHSKPGNRNAAAWKKMYSSPANRQSFVDNYARPLVERYKDNPWFFAIDVGNELVWTWENHQVARKDTLDLVARVANAVHGHSRVLVCEGEGAGPKYNSDKFAGNLYSDKSLGALQPGAHVDFFNLHYYDWVRPYFGSPFERSPADYGIDDKPCIIGECPARGSAGQSIAENYRNAFAKGWQGIMPWTSNGADRNGDLKTMRPGLEWLVKTHPQLIDPAR
jgi:hypothetical protein